MISELLNKMEALLDLQLDSNMLCGDSGDYEQDLEYAWQLIAVTTVRYVTILADILIRGRREIHPTQKIGLLV